MEVTKHPVHLIYLSGPSGVGKTTFGDSLAKMLQQHTDYDVVRLPSISRQVAKFFGYASWKEATKTVDRYLTWQTALLVAFVDTEASVFDKEHDKPTIYIADRSLTDYFVHGVAFAPEMRIEERALFIHELSNSEYATQNVMRMMRIKPPEQCGGEGVVYNAECQDQAPSHVKTHVWTFYQPEFFPKAIEDDQVRPVHTQAELEDLVSKFQYTHAALYHPEARFFSSTPLQRMQPAGVSLDDLVSMTISPEEVGRLAKRVYESGGEFVKQDTDLVLNILLDIGGKNV